MTLISEVLRALRARRAAHAWAVAAVALTCFAAIVSVARADHYHTTCVGHGFVHGDNLNDGSFFSRVEAGCGSTYRRCELYSYGTWRGTQVVSGSTATCNAWSNEFGSYTECAGSAHTYSAGVFADHAHRAHNWCGG